MIATEPDEIAAMVEAEMKEIMESIERLLGHAFGDANSSKACRDALLGACRPDYYKFDFSDLLYLDSSNKQAALKVLNHRIITMESIEGLIGYDKFKRLSDAWERENTGTNMG
jgi:hypothetical protein